MPPTGSIDWDAFGLATATLSPAQAEAELRDAIGISIWELVGAAWFDSLINGECIRR